MGKLMYCAITSLDHYLEDADGTSAGRPDEDVHRFSTTSSGRSGRPLGYGAA